MKVLIISLAKSHDPQVSHFRIRALARNIPKPRFRMFRA